MTKPGERIIGWLRASTTPLSGEELARRLGCSRAAVWKQIAALRERGWAIAAHHAAGYTLAETPDRLGPAELAPHLGGTWRHVEWLAETDSTQRVARDLARAGAAEGTAVFAETQTAGRGRLGRVWHSPPGANVYVSVILRPPLAPTAVPQLALVAGLAVADAVRACGVPAGLKWPNDVVVGRRKLAGILTEMEAEVERVHHVIAGIGVNVNVDAFPDALAPIATSMRLEAGKPVDRVAFAGRLLVALEARYGAFVSQGLDVMRSDWERLSCLTGREVRVAAPEGEITGRAVGLDADGALRLEGPGGRQIRVVAGDVTIRDGYGGA